MAWLAVLAMPIRTLYASDSKAVVNKANRLIEAARKLEQSGTEQHQSRKGNPFGKPWGMQPDGEVREQAWQAVLRRGAENQRIRKGQGSRYRGRRTKRHSDEKGQGRQPLQRPERRQRSRSFIWSRDGQTSTLGCSKTQGIQAIHDANPSLYCRDDPPY